MLIFEVRKDIYKRGEDFVERVLFQMRTENRSFGSAKRTDDAAELVHERVFLLQSAAVLLQICSRMDDSHMRLENRFRTVLS